MSSSSSADVHHQLASAPTGHDHLTVLPLELLGSVCSYLYPDHDPDLAFHPDRRYVSCSHSLDYLAASSRHMRAAVNAWAQSYLLQHASITGYQHPNTIADTKPNESDNEPESDHPALPANHLRGPSGLLTWSSTHCVFCGGALLRRAVFANGICCCIACDDNFWPNKITKTAARSQYSLKELDLFPGNETGIAGGRVATPGLQHGTYASRGTPATVFLKDELQSLADRLHGTGWEAQKSEKASRRRSKRAQRQNINVEMMQKRIELFYCRSSDFDGWAQGDEEELLCDAPEGWSELPRAAQIQQLGDLPNDWFDLTVEERKVAVVEICELREELERIERNAQRMARMQEQDERWERQWRKEQDFERRVLEQDAAIDLELLSNEPPGWFEMTTVERHDRFQIRKLDVDFERRISKHEEDVELELFDDEAPGWFEMTLEQREKLFAVKEVV